MARKPDNLQLVTHDFKTPAHRAAAREILLLWDKTHNFEELSDRTGWSPPHLRNVFKTYFEGAEGFESASNPIEADVVSGTGDLLRAYRVDQAEGYQKGYREGYRDGQADA